ncbi:MAG: hypothetical protein ACQETH_09250 [Candidatus Rifleibacteriota bacterium]
MIVLKNRLLASIALLLMMFCIVVSLSAESEDSASASLNLQIGFENQQLNFKVNTPQFQDFETDTWVDSDSELIKKTLSNPNPSQEDFTPDEYSINDIPSHPSQQDNIPPKKLLPQPFEDPNDEIVLSKREAAIEFLEKRPDILEFVKVNTGKTDPIEVLELWVYSIMKSDDSDWKEGKRILEELE